MFSHTWGSLIAIALALWYIHEKQTCRLSNFCVYAYVLVHVCVHQDRNDVLSSFLYSSGKNNTQFLKYHLPISVVYECFKRYFSWCYTQTIYNHCPKLIKNADSKATLLMCISEKPKEYSFLELCQWHVCILKFEIVRFKVSSARVMFLGRVLWQAECFELSDVGRLQKQVLSDLLPPAYLPFACLLPHPNAHKRSHRNKNFFPPRSVIESRTVLQKASHKTIKGHSLTFSLFS